MAAFTTEQLVAASKCYDREIPIGSQLPVMIWLLAQIAGVSADPQSLMASAGCIDQCIPTGMKLGVAIDLLYQIQQKDPTGSCLLSGVGPPVAAPPCSVAIYFSTDTNPGMWVWIASEAIWTEVIAPGP